MTYIFNECKVCQNPDVEVLVNTPRWYIDLSFAEHNELWYYGYSFIKLFGDHSSSSCGASYGEHRQSYQTQQDARKAGLQRAIERYEKYPDLLQQLRAAEHPQLTLF